MKKNILSVSFILLFAIGFTFSVNSQIQEVWKKTYRSSFNISDVGKEIHTDQSGNVYVGAHSFAGVQNKARNTVIKYDANGTFLWDYHSVDESYIMEDMLVDVNGNVYYAGAKWQDSSAEWDFLIGKIDSAGNEVWNQIYDGNGSGAGWDYGWSISMDDDAKLYMTGHSQGAFNGYDFLTAKFDTSGNLLWARNYEDPHLPGQQANYENDAFEVLADVNGNVYVSGYTLNDTDSSELTLLKYDSAGTFQWVRTYDIGVHWTTADINKTFMKLAGDKIYLAGNVVDSTNCNILVLKYDSTGSLIWEKHWDSPGHDSDYVSANFTTDEALVIDQNENIYVAGVSSVTNVLFLEDIHTIKLDSAGNVLWSNTFDGANDEDICKGISIDNSGNVFVCGSTYTSSALNERDYVTLRINGITGMTEWVEVYNAPVDWMDEAAAIKADGMGGVYVTGFAMRNQDPFDAKFEVTTIKYASLPVSVNEVSTPNSVLVFPNPVVNTLYISTAEESFVRITDAFGKIVLVQKLQKGVTGINVSSLANGVYFYSANEISGKLIVAH